MAKPNNFRMSKVETERRVRSLHSLNGAQLSSKNQEILDPLSFKSRQIQIRGKTFFFAISLKICHYSIYSLKLVDCLSNVERIYSFLFDSKLQHSAARNHLAQRSFLVIAYKYETLPIKIRFLSFFST